ncbi:MAG: Gfo/Idh/MocA family oxidoreductase [Microbacteriaceae bacterium]|nr:MAG: Gfo/Idh/MocA family oxidoreductase [Microbacteriaceae bacterium]
MKIVQVGLGFWGRGWMQILAGSDDVQLVAVVDNDESARAWAVGSGAVNAGMVFASLSECLSRVTDVDSVLITVPPSAHLDVALEAIENGLACLVEKPLAPTLDEAATIVSEADRKNCVVMAAQNYRFKRAAATVAWLVNERKAVGAVERVSVRFGAAPSFTGFRLSMDEPLIVDMAIHHFDLMRAVLGVEPTEVYAHSFNPSWSPFQGNACANVEFRCAAGATINYQGSWCERGPLTSWDGSWTIEGDRGCVTWIANRVKFYAHYIDDSVYLDGAIERNGNEMDVPLRELQFEERRGTLHEFASAVAEKRIPVCSGRDNLNTLAMVFGAVKSHRAGGLVPL